MWLWFRYETLEYVAMSFCSWDHQGCFKSNDVRWNNPFLAPEQKGPTACSLFCAHPQNLWGTQCVAVLRGNLSWSRVNSSYPICPISSWLSVLVLCLNCHSVFLVQVVSVPRVPFKPQWILSPELWIRYWNFLPVPAVFTTNEQDLYCKALS